MAFGEDRPAICYRQQAGWRRQCRHRGRRACPGKTFFDPRHIRREARGLNSSAKTRAQFRPHTGGGWGSNSGSGLERAAAEIERLLVGVIRLTSDHQHDHIADCLRRGRGRFSGAREPDAAIGRFRGIATSCCRRPPGQRTFRRNFRRPFARAHHLRFGLTHLFASGLFAAMSLFAMTANMMARAGPPIFPGASQAPHRDGQQAAKPLI
jgi:hypothetical protein